MENAIFDELGRYIAGPQPAPDPWVRPAGIWDGNAAPLRLTDPDVVICSWCPDAKEKTAAAKAAGLVASHTVCAACLRLQLAELDAMTRVA